MKKIGYTGPMNGAMTAVLGLLAVAALSGCDMLTNMVGVHPNTPTPGQAFEGMQCSAVRPQTEPDLMGWDPGSRANLNSLSNQGVVAVRYAANGCDVQLEVISNCIGRGKYAYETYAATQTKFARNQQELYAQLPLGAANLAGRLQGNRSLRTDYMLVGMRTLKAGSGFNRALLRGPDCARATHIVTRVYVGGFAMAAGETQSLSAAATVFGSGVGGYAGGLSEVVFNEGIAGACAAAQNEGRESPLCVVPLRLGLMKLDEVGVRCPPGTIWSGNECKGTVNTSCAPGLHFVEGTGCVPDLVVPPPPPPNDPQACKDARSLAAHGDTSMAYHLAVNQCQKLGGRP